MISESFPTRNDRWLFIIACGWNMSAAAVALLAPAFHAQVFFGPGASLAEPAAQLNTQAFWVSVALFGLGYGLIARDPSRNHGIVGLAALGKFYVAMMWSWYFFRGDAGILALLGAIGDFSFALLFVRFLLRARRASPPSFP